MNRLTKMILAGALLLGTSVAWAGGDTAAKPKAPATQPTAPAKKKAPPPPADKPAPPPEEAPPAAGSSSASADIKAGTGYENHAVTGEAASFPAGTKVYAVSVVSGAKDTTVKHVWKKDGAEIWSASLHVGSSRWTTASMRTLSKPGSYEVDVVGEDGGDLGKIEFAIQ
jgi:Protein of unknown function (DUF2914)